MYFSYVTFSVKKVFHFSKMNLSILEMAKKYEDYEKKSVKLFIYFMLIKYSSLTLAYAVIVFQWNE